MPALSYIYSRSYAEDVTSVTSGASQGPHSFNSRSYAEDVTLFVCLFTDSPEVNGYLSWESHQTNNVMK